MKHKRMSESTAELLTRLLDLVILDAIHGDSTERVQQETRIVSEILWRTKESMSPDEIEAVRSGSYSEHAPSEKQKAKS